MPVYESLVRDHHALVYRVAFGVLRDRSAAEDVAQDVFLEFLRHPEGVDRADNARAFVGRAAVNRALNARRGEARRVKHEQAAFPGEATMNPVEEVFRREIRAKVAELPEEERLAVDLHYFQGFTLAETAAALDIAHRTVSARLSDAFSKLRKSLGAAAFVGLLASLESELSLCGAEEVPSTIADRLLRLRNRPPSPVSTAGPRFAAVVVSMGIVLLLALFGAKRFRAWRDSREVGTEMALMNANPKVPDVAIAGPAGSSQPAVAGIDRDCDLHGIVITETGSPVEGVLLSTVTHPWRRTHVHSSEARDEEILGPGTRSAADGSFVIRLRRGDIVTLRVSADGFARYEIPKCQAGERLRIVVRPGARLVVRALDLQGQAVAGVRLHLRRREYEHDLYFEFNSVTGLDGTSVFADVPGARDVLITGEHDLLGDPGMTDVRLPDSGEVRVELTMPFGGDLSGRVTDSTTGKAIPGARVGSNWFKASPAVADAEGRYRLPRCPPNTGFFITADAEGYVPESKLVLSVPVQDFALLPGDTVTGRLLTSSSLAIPGARVSATTSRIRGNFQGYNSRTGVSDDAGYFRLTGLSREVPHTLLAMADGFGLFLLDFDPHPNSAGTVNLGDIVLPEGCAVEGRVLDADGNPAPRIEVSLSGFNADRDRLHPGASPAFDPFVGGAEDVTSDDLGRFRFRDLAPGNYVARMTVGGSPEVESAFTIPPDRLLTFVELRVPRTDGIRVLVQDDRGVAVEGVRVYGQESESRRAMATTGPDGRVVLRLAAPSVKVSIEVRETEENPVLTPGDQVTTADSRDLTFVIIQTGSASGEVVTTDGNLLPNALIQIFTDGVGGSCILSDDKGRFIAPFPPPGPVDLVLIERTSEPGTNPGTEDIPVFFEGRLERVFAGSKGLQLVARRVAKDRSLVMRFLTPDGHPAAGITVIVFLVPDLLSAATDAEGIVSFPGLPAIPLPVTAWSPEHDEWLSYQTSVLPDGQEIVSRFRLGAWLEGIVVDPDGWPVAGAVVIARADSVNVNSTNSGEDGRFRLLLDPEESRQVDLVGSKQGDVELVGSLKGFRHGGTPVTLRLEKK